MNRFLTALTPLLARVLVAALFLYSGWSKLMHPAGPAMRIATRGLPLAKPGAVLAGVAEVGLGVLLVLGAKTRPAALALVAYVLVVTYLFHWGAAMGGDAAQLIQVLKNGAILGALLLLASFGPGPTSLDRS